MCNFTLAECVLAVLFLLECSVVMAAFVVYVSDAFSVVFRLIPLGNTS